MKFHALLFVLFVMVRTASAAPIVTYVFNTNGNGTVDPAFAGITADVYNTRSSILGDDGSNNTITGFSTRKDNAYLRASGTTTSSLPVNGTPAYHIFGLTVGGLEANEVLNLSDISFLYETTGDTDTTFFISVYGGADGTDFSGYGLSERLGDYTHAAGAERSAVVNVDLTSGNSAAGTDFTSLSNGDGLEFRIYFGNSGGSDVNGTSAIHRIGGSSQGLIINGDILVVPEPATGILALGAFAGLLLVCRFSKHP